MPRKPKRPCSYPGCPKLVDGQYCEEHKKLIDKQYNEYGRDNFTKSFYKSPEWLKVRKLQLLSHPLCAECLKKGKHTKATMVDHIIPRRCEVWPKQLAKPMLGVSFPKKCGRR